MCSKGQVEEDSRNAIKTNYQDKPSGTNSRKKYNKNKKEKNRRLSFVVGPVIFLQDGPNSEDYPVNVIKATSIKDRDRKSGALFLSQNPIGSTVSNVSAYS